MIARFDCMVGTAQCECMVEASLELVCWNQLIDKMFVGNESLGMAPAMGEA